MAAYLGGIAALYCTVCQRDAQVVDIVSVFMAAGTTTQAESCFCCAVHQQAGAQARWQVGNAGTSGAKQVGAYWGIEAVAAQLKCQRIAQSAIVARCLGEYRVGVNQAGCLRAGLQQGKQQAKGKQRGP